MATSQENGNELGSYTLSEARALLWRAEMWKLKDFYTGSSEIGWTKDGEEIAGGLDGCRVQEVWLKADAKHSHTRFEGAVACELMECYSVQKVQLN